ncbi:putative collagen alpha-1(III) chain, related protein [Toxoplasma gondii GAB2-2007-GAL-DOM2]|uniref:Putative collagen alpha-1(III) chain, related protein n=4 Tax=Toxoplasma gondii TaxID=5811 RepID=A0A086LHI5_TOXGO|nr:putative collagen alpha-1(III) chain, related protein [Toxoplasma gondii GAB2-2007-GAL-DOM2]KFG56103.1 putative collagen alpha-1(III) chain, related protein [Toxoplasma gondii FOU]PUA91623.1 putative collagen alpha-1(III) chain, related protein [Toxoplasma gondii TgCATBr9]
MSGTGGAGSGPLGSAGGARGGSKSSAPRPVKIAAVSLVDLKEQASKTPTPSRGWGVIPQPATSVESSGMSSSLFPPVSALKQQFHGSTSSSSQANAVGGRTSSSFARAVRGLRNLKEETGDEISRGDGEKEAQPQERDGECEKEERGQNEGDVKGQANAGAELGDRTKPTAAETQQPGGSLPNDTNVTFEKGGEEREKDSSQKHEGEKTKEEPRQDASGTVPARSREDESIAATGAISLSKLITASRKVGISVSVRGRAVNTAAGTVKSSGSAWKSGVSAAASSGASSSAPFSSRAASSSGPASSLYAARAGGAAPATGSVDDEAFPDLMKSAEQVKLEAQKEKDRQKRTKEALRRVEKDENGSVSQPQTRRLGLQELFDLTSEGGALSSLGDKTGLGDKEGPGAARPIRIQRRWADEEPDEEEDFLQAGEGEKGGFYSGFDGRRELFAHFSPLPHFVLPGMEGTVVAGYLSFMSLGQRVPPPAPPPMETYPSFPTPPHPGAPGPAGPNFRTNAFYNLPGAGPFGEGAQPSLLQEKNWRRQSSGPDGAAGSLLPTTAFQGGPHPGRLHFLQRGGDGEGPRTLPPPGAIDQGPDRRTTGVVEGAPQRGPFGVTDADLERQRELARQKAEEKKREEEAREREQKERANKKLQELDERLARSREIQGVEQATGTGMGAPKAAEGALVGSPTGGRMEKGRGVSLQGRGARGPGPRGAAAAVDEREDEDWRRPSPAAGVLPPAGAASGRKSPRGPSAGANVSTPYAPSPVPRNPPPPPPLSAPAIRGRHEPGQKSLLGAGKNLQIHQGSGDPQSGPLLGANPSPLIGADLHAARHMKKGEMKGEPGVSEGDVVAFPQAGLLGAKSHQPPPPPPATAGPLGARGPVGKGLAGTVGDRDGLRLVRGRQGVQGSRPDSLARGANGEEPLPPLLGRERGGTDGSQFSAPLLQTTKHGHRDEEIRPGFHTGRRPTGQNAGDRPGQDSENEGDLERRQQAPTARPRYRFGALVNQHLEERQKEEEEVRQGPHGRDAGAQGASQREKSARGDRGAGQQSGAATTDHSRSQSVRRRGESAGSGADSGTWRQAPRQVNGVAGDQGASASACEPALGPEGDSRGGGPGRDRGQGDGQRGRGPRHDPGLAAQPLLPDGSSPSSAGAVGLQKPLPRGMLPFPSPMRGAPQANGGTGPVPETDGPHAVGASGGRERPGRGSRPGTSPTRDNWRAEKAPAAPGAGGFCDDPSRPASSGGRGGRDEDRAAGLVSGARSQGGQQYFHGAYSHASGAASQPGASPLLQGGTERGGPGGPQRPPLIANAPLLGFAPPAGGIDAGRELRSKAFPASAGAAQGGVGRSASATRGPETGPQGDSQAPVACGDSGPQGAETTFVKDLHKNATLWQLSSASFPSGVPRKLGANNASGGEGAEGAGLLRKPVGGAAGAGEKRAAASGASGAPDAPAAQPVTASGGSGDLSFKALLSTRPAPTVLVATHHSTKSDEGAATCSTGGGAAGPEGPHVGLAPEPVVHGAAGDKTRGPGAAGVLGDTPHQATDGDGAVTRGPGGKVFDVDERGKDRARKGERGAAFGARGAAGGDSAAGAGEPAGPEGGIGISGAHPQVGNRGQEKSHAKADEGERGAGRNAGAYRKAGGNADGSQRVWGVVEKPGKAPVSRGRDEEKNQAPCAETTGRPGASGRRRSQQPFEGEREDISGAGTGRGPHSKPQRGGHGRREGEETAHAGEGGSRVRGAAASTGNKDSASARRGVGVGRGGAEAGRARGGASEVGRAPSPGGAGDNAAYPKGRDQGLLGTRGGKGGRGSLRGGAASGRGSAYVGERATGGMSESNAQPDVHAPEDGASRHRGQGGPISRDRAAGTGAAVWLPKGATKKGETVASPGAPEAGAGPRRGGETGQLAGSRGPAESRQGDRGSPSASAGPENQGGAAPHTHARQAASGLRDSRSNSGSMPPAVADALLTRVNGALSVGAGLVCVTQEDNQEETAGDDEGFQLVKSKRREQQEKRKKAEHKQRGSDRGAAAKATPFSSPAAPGSARSNSRREKGQSGTAAGGDALGPASGTPGEALVPGSTASKSEGPVSSPRDQGTGAERTEPDDSGASGRGPRHDGGGRRPSASPRGGGRGGAQQRGEGRKEFPGKGLRTEVALTASSTMEVSTVSSEVTSSVADHRTRQRGQEEKKTEDGEAEKKELTSASGLLPLPGGGSQGGGRGQHGRGSGKGCQDSGDAHAYPGEGRASEKSDRGEGSGFSRGAGAGSSREDGAHGTGEKGRERRGSSGRGADRRVGGHMEEKRRPESPAEVEGGSQRQAHSAPTNVGDPWYASQDLDAANAMSHRLSSDPSQSAVSDSQGTDLMIPSGPTGHQGNAGAQGADRERAGASPSAGAAPAPPTYSLWSSNFNQPATASSRVAPETIAAIWARDPGSGPTAVGGAPRGARLPAGPGGAPADMAGLASHHPMTPVGMPLSPHHQGAPGAPFHAGGGQQSPGPLGPLHFQCPPIHSSLQGSRGSGGPGSPDASGSLCASQPQLLGHGASSHRVPPSHLLHASQHLMHTPGAAAATLFQPGCYGAPGGGQLPPGAPRMPAQRNVTSPLTGGPQSLSKNEMLAPPLLPGRTAPGLVTLAPGQGSASPGAASSSPRLDLYDPRNPLSGPSFSPVPGVSAPGAHPGVVAGAHSSSYVVPEAGHQLLPGFAHPQGAAFSPSLSHDGAPSPAPGAPGSGRAAGQALWVPGGPAPQGSAFVPSAPGHHQQGRGHSIGRGNDMLAPQGFGSFIAAQGGRNGAQRFGVMGAGQPGAGAPGGGEFYM